MLNFFNQNINNLNNENLRQGESNNINTFETLQKARKDLIGELDAIIQYDDHLHSTNINIAKQTWENIRNEELVHVGELLSLITYLGPYQKALIEQGEKEFAERLNNKN